MDTVLQSPLAVGGGSGSLHSLYGVLIAVTVLWVLMMLRWAILSQYPIHSVKKMDEWNRPENIGNCAGVSSIQGRRPHMEDTYQAHVNIKGDSKIAFYGVFDGHGGSKAAVFTADHVWETIAHYDYINDPRGALHKGYLELDRQWLTHAAHHLWDDGTTAISALICRGTIYVSNIGDSRCVLASKGIAVEMSSDHKPDREDEKERIESLGGRILCYGTWRVEGMLAVTRAIGDRKLKKYVSAEPEIRERVLREGDDYLILASDGVWDVLTNQEAVDLVYKINDAKQAAEHLTQVAFQRHSQDNATALVVDLRPYRL
jgi:protein phosphatase 1L